MKIVYSYIAAFIALIAVLSINTVGLSTPYIKIVASESGTAQINASASEDNKIDGYELNNFCLPSINPLYTPKCVSEQARTIKNSNLYTTAISQLIKQISGNLWNLHHTASRYGGINLRGIDYYIYTLEKIII